MPLRRLVDSNFLEYASYVIKERAIPDINDGLKPVQRRIFHSLNEMDDGKFSKVANIIGHCMRYHPHGDASIGDALVVLANKEYFIEKQGNFGNILTGDSASAARYIEARLSPLAREVLFNRDITEYSDSYDGRNKEPVVLPAKIPVLLMMGAEGIAVGMSTKILPHNFGEILKSQIACLKGKPFSVLPDFLHGGIADVSEYMEGRGKVRCRALIEDKGKSLVIREIPFSTTVESLIASVEDAARRGKIKISSINDYTAENVEIELSLMRGGDSRTTLEQLYLYTDCEVSLNSSIIVIKESRPVEMSVPEIIRYCTDKLVRDLEKELEIALARFRQRLHIMTLEQIFIEKKLYKKIEQCVTYEAVQEAVAKSLRRYRSLLERDVSADDIESLLSIRIKRISKFDMEKYHQSVEELQGRIRETLGFLDDITGYTIDYIQSLIGKYARDFPRKTKLKAFDRVDAAAVAVADEQVYYDKKTGYLGSSLKTGVLLKCTSFDRLLLMDKKFNYKVMQIPEKVFTGKLIHVDIYKKGQVFNVVYSRKSTGHFYVKRFKVEKYITDKEYRFLPDNDVKLEHFSLGSGVSICLFYEPGSRMRKTEETFLLDDFLIKGSQAQGTRISTKKIEKIKVIKK